MTTDSDHVPKLSVHFGQPLAQTTNQRVNGLFADAFTDCFRPDSIDDLVTRHNTASRVPKRFQQSILMQAEWRIQHDAIDPNLTRLRFKAQPLAGAFKRQRGGRTGIDKGQLETKCNLQLIAIGELGGFSYALPIDMGPVLTS